MCSQDDLDLVRADGDGMYAREPHHPTMTDPPGGCECDLGECTCGFEAVGASIRVPVLMGKARAREHYTDVLTAARWKNTLEAIAKRAEAGLPMSTSALRDVINLANAALEIPPLGTRVRCLLPHRGEFGTIVSWDHDLGVPHARWDSDGTIEAVESHEYTTDLNEEG